MRKDRVWTRHCNFLIIVKSVDSIILYIIPHMHVHNTSDQLNFNAFFYTVRTGIEEVALLRSKLESLHLQVAEATDELNQQLSTQLKTCYDFCQLAYHKLGNEHRRYVEDLEEHKKREQNLYQMLNAATEQGNSIDYYPV